MNKDGKGYHKLIVWQKARELVRLIYLHTESFPKAEMFGLQGQVRRAAVSIVLNIVEGNKKHTIKDYIHFLNIAEGSISELEAALEICLDLKFISEENYHIIEMKRGEVGYLLSKLITALKNK